MSIFSFLKKKQNTEESLPPFCGFTLGADDTSYHNDALYHCLIKGVLIFAASFAAIWGFASEFDLSFNIILTAIIIFLVSMYLSLIHMRKLFFNVGYPLFFVVFVEALISTRAYANSGFQALINIVNETYGAHFNLAFTRESTEIIANRYVTLTVVFIFIGIFLAILINVGIFDEMFFLTTFNMTFWILQFGIYIGKYPSYFALALLFFAYFGVYFLKHSGHYYFTSPVKDSHVLSYEIKEKQHIFYKSNSKFMKQMVLFALMISLVFSMFTALTIPASEREAVKSNSIKKEADEYVKIFVQNGFLALFNRYTSTGGISEGKLGGVSSVRPDYQTDLTVTFVPYAYDTLYLKAYTGTIYTGNSWDVPTETEYVTKGPDDVPVAVPYEEVESFNGFNIPIDDTDVVSGNDVSNTSGLSYEEYITYQEESALTALMATQDDVAPMHAKILITNEDASIKHMYLPYYTQMGVDGTSISPQKTTEGMHGKYKTIEAYYTPYSEGLSRIMSRDEGDYCLIRDTTQSEMFHIYSVEVYNNYLQIPDDIWSELNAYHDVIGDPQTPQEAYVMIRNFLYANYKYDLAPGATPYGEDFALYFLGSQKRGYCAHFATAATLLFRSYGIPARYVEGYAVTQNNIMDRAALAEESYDDFFLGENTLGVTDVVTVEVTDGEAHAWTEIFIDGFGWIPVDLTAPDEDEEYTSYQDFLSTFSSLLSPNGGTMTSTQGESDAPSAMDRLNRLNLGNSPFVLVFFAVAIVLMCIPFLMRLFAAIKAQHKRQKDYRNHAYKGSISYAYVKAKHKIQKKYPDVEIKIPEDMQAFLDEHFDSKDVSRMIALTQRALFSADSIDKSTADEIIKFYRDVTKTI